MKKYFLYAALGLIAPACGDENVPIDAKQCGTEATVRDLTGLDGCGFVFELKDGTRLEPIRVFYCGTPPLPKEMTEDPLYNFQFVAGKRVRIGYELLLQQTSICMVGKVVKITCLEEISSAEK